MREVTLTPRADADLADIYAYSIENFGFEQADVVRDNLLTRLDTLAEYPMLGSDQSHMRLNTRRLVHELFSIYYEVTDDSIRVLRILGPGQDPTRHF